MPQKYEQRDHETGMSTWKLAAVTISKATLLKKLMGLTNMGHERCRNTRHRGREKCPNVGIRTARGDEIGAIVASLFAVHFFTLIETSDSN